MEVTPSGAGLSCVVLPQSNVLPTPSGTGLAVPVRAVVAPSLLLPSAYSQVFFTPVPLSSVWMRMRGYTFHPGGAVEYSESERSQPVVVLQVKRKVPEAWSPPGAPSAARVYWAQT